MKKLTLFLLLSLGLTSVAFAQEEVPADDIMVTPTVAPGFVDFDPANPPFETVEISPEASVQTEAEANAQIEADILELEAQSGMEVGVEAQSGVAVIADPRIAVFAQTYVANNADAMDAEVDTNGKASMTVKDSGKLFGLFTVEMNKKVYIEAMDENQVKVTVKNPWWAFLVAGDAYADLGAELEADINASLQV
jgi:uncharacterized protein involved in high-affinity Fe2+ transport